MADFLKAWEKVSFAEGGYANDPNDKGGETYRGISRVFNPDWEGWPLVDEARKKPGFPHSLPHESALNDMVTEFYFALWSSLPCQAVPQNLAEAIFDTATNNGAKRAIQFLQVALNALNCNGLYWAEVTPDGNYGPKTMTAVKVLIDGRQEAKLLVKTFGIVRGNFYLDIMAKRPDQEKFARSWLNRVNLEPQEA
jgi:lysozyme family protein